MKRNAFILILSVLLLAVLPASVYATTYKLSGTDMSVSLDDSSWYVFTRDNITDNPELEELGLKYQDIYDVLYDNNAYVNACLFYEDGGFVEMFVRKVAIDTGMANLSNYKEKEVLELAKEIAKRRNTKDYSVYESQYKFANLKYKDSGYYICEYYTVVNRDAYTVTFQSETEFVAEEYAEMKRIVDSISFDVDTSLKEEGDSFWDGVLGGVIKGAAIGAVVGGIIAVVGKKKKNGGNNNASSAFGEEK